ncbi:MAG: alpha/beta hydrolase [Proteobacteria bacterium]|nr:alpha/beta hydrolase [Pseudomonadota bacterium]
MSEIAPQLGEWLEKYNRLMDAWLEKGGVQTPEIARDGLARLTRTLVTEVPSLPLIREEYVAGPDHFVPVRVFHPEPTKALPVLVYLHGGGHVAGSVAVFDPLCRKMALATRRLVVAVEYRLAPEHPYPAGLQDASAVINGYSELLQRMGLLHQPHLALAGDSAGGAMSATLAHVLQSQGLKIISHLVLLYPSLDYTLSLPSVEALAKGYLLEKERILWYLRQYFKNNEDRGAASPLYMDIPECFPQTLIVSAGFCPLRDEAMQYVQKLRNSGVTVWHLHFDDMIHAFLNMESLAPERCRAVYQAMADFLSLEVQNN